MIQVQFLQKIIAIQVNLKHIAIMSKDKVYLYDLAGMIFVHRLNLEHHLGRIHLAANISGERPLFFYSNSTDQGTLKVFDIEQRKLKTTLLCH